MEEGIEKLGHELETGVQRVFNPGESTADFVPFEALDRVKSNSVAVKVNYLSFKYIYK